MMSCCSNTFIGHLNYVGIQHKHANVDDIPLTHDDRKELSAVLEAILDNRNRKLKFGMDWFRVLQSTQRHVA
ncbi:hypothetical protein DPMN_142746 [Dreissena polymorpha]|uniref:Uncharacterized protein n=1 Tax=Dreissena polymorpha TaxID=45954 RepID=A0A9D4JNR0_DREPO|nr:hypothetical protein DPMN_142746 [Dreissena polymorpha]